MKAFCIVSCSLALVFQMHAQGYLVQNGVTFVPGNLPETRVLQNPTNGDYSGFLWQSQGANSFAYLPLLNFGVRTFLVSPNDPVAFGPISAGAYTEVKNSGSYVFANGTPFYLGFYAGYYDTQHPSDHYPDPLFGWGEFVNNSGTISMLGSALEYGGGGILAGTLNILPVPEPSAIALLVTGVSVVLLRRRRKVR
jgi:hypothetical protein